jgi:outer membrane protein OmpA-like peptidoglycan-associated protein
MKKIVLLFSLFFSFSCFLNAQNFMVQVAAFNTKVENSYFKGVENITYVKDRNDIHRYYIMGLTSSAAQNTAAELIKKGYKAQIIDTDEVSRQCKISCNTPALPTKIDVKSLQWIFFDFDKADLRSTSRNELSKVNSILSENPTYTVELSAHTDAKGSNEYNQALSERRASNAKNYLSSNGIAASRIKTSTNGETSPIAKNDLNGKDTEEGRQFNRRVEIRIFDAAGKQVNMVDAPSIPTGLK